MRSKSEIIAIKNRLLMVVLIWWMNIQVLDSNGGYEFCIKPFIKVELHNVSFNSISMWHSLSSIIFLCLTKHLICKIWSEFHWQYKKHVCNVQLNMHDKTRECIIYYYKNLWLWMCDIYSKTPKLLVLLGLYYKNI